MHQSSQLVPEVTVRVEAPGDNLSSQKCSDMYNECNYSGTDNKSSKKSDGGCYKGFVKNEVEKDGEVSEETKGIINECPSNTLANLCVYP